MELLKLGDIVDYRKGFAFKSELYSNEGIRVVRVTDFSLDSIEKNDGVFIPEDESYKKHILQEGDILIQTVGSWANNPNSIVGKVVRVPYYASGSYLNQNIVKIIPHKNIDKDYLFYSMKANKFSIFCVNRGQGAANQASITLSTILRFKFLAHPYEEQVKIGKILATYRRAIEINDRRIELLSSISREIFEEWFVRFRFPGHENVEMENGIPNGWNVMTLDDIISENPKSKIKVSDANNSDDTYPFYTSGKAILKYHDYLVDGINIFVNTGGVADIKMNIGKSHYSTDTWCIKGVQDYTLFLYSYLCSIKDEIQSSYFEGAALKHLKKQFLKKKKVLVPPSSVIEKYNKQIEAMFQLITKLLIEKENLIKQRDLLLPRLMSGKLEVTV